MPQKTDYASIVIPEGKDPKKYTLEERRAEEYWEVWNSGTIKVLHVSKMGERYGKDISTISRDRKAIQEYILNAFTRAKILPEIITTKKWAMEQARKKGDYKSADAISDSILRMAQDLGILDKAAEKIDVTGRLHGVLTLDDFKVLYEESTEREEKDIEE